MPVLDLEALRAAPLKSDPFPYVVVRNFVGGEAFDAAVRDYPKMAHAGSFPVFTQTPGPGLQAVLAAIDGPEFRKAVEEKLGVDLKGRPTMTTLRGRARARDGQIHIDSKTKLVTVLLYMNKASGSWEDHAGCLRILRGPDDLENYVEEIPPTDGTLLLFPCLPHAWHGHPGFEGERRVIQLNWVTDEGVVRREQRRHGVSAFFKKLNPFKRAA